MVAVTVMLAVPPELNCVVGSSFRVASDAVVKVTETGDRDKVSVPDVMSTSENCSMKAKFVPDDAATIPSLAPEALFSMSKLAVIAVATPSVNAAGDGADIEKVFTLGSVTIIFMKSQVYFLFQISL